MSKRNTIKKTGARRPTAIRQKATVQLYEVELQPLTDWVEWLATYFVTLHSSSVELGHNTPMSQNAGVTEDDVHLYEIILATLKSWCHDMVKRQPLRVACPVPIASFLMTVLERTVDMGTGHPMRFYFNIPGDWDIDNPYPNKEYANADSARQMFGIDGQFSRLYGWKHYTARNYLEGEKFKQVNFVFGIKDKNTGVSSRVVKTYDVCHSNMARYGNTANNQYMKLCVGQGNKTLVQLTAIMLSNGPAMVSADTKRHEFDSVTFARLSDFKQVRDNAKRAMDQIIQGGADAILGIIGYNDLKKNRELGAAATQTVIDAIINTPSVSLPSTIHDVPSAEAFSTIILAAFCMREPLLFPSQFMPNAGPQQVRSRATAGNSGDMNKYNKYIRTICEASVASTLLPNSVAESVNANLSCLMMETNQCGVAMPFIQNITYFSDDVRSVAAGDTTLDYPDLSAQSLLRAYCGLTEAGIPANMVDDDFMASAIGNAKATVDTCVDYAGIIKLSPALSEDLTAMKLTSKIMVLGHTPQEDASEQKSILKIDDSKLLSASSKLGKATREMLNERVPTGKRTGNTSAGGKSATIHRLTSFFHIWNARRLSAEGITADDSNTAVVKDAALAQGDKGPTPGSAAYALEFYLAETNYRHNTYMPPTQGAARYGHVQMFTRMPEIVTDSDAANKLNNLILWPYEMGVFQRDSAFITYTADSFNSRKQFLYGYVSVGICGHDNLLTVARSNLCSITGEEHRYYQYLQYVIQQNGGWASRLFDGVKRVATGAAKFALKNSDTFLGLGKMGLDLGLGLAQQSGNRTLSNLAGMVSDVIS